jgi:hypothetical protein
MSDLQSSSEHRDKGLLSPNRRMSHLRRVIEELRIPPHEGKPATESEANAAQDLCYRLYSAEASDLMAVKLGVTRQQIREALDAAIQWTPPVAVQPQTPPQANSA